MANSEGGSYSMGKVYYNVRVSVPNNIGIVVEHHKKYSRNRVYFDFNRIYDQEKGYASPTHRFTIGYCTNEAGYMYPNENFKRFFPLEWAEAVAQNSEFKVNENADGTIPYHLTIGLYAVIFLICTKFHIIGLLGSIFGTFETAAILDFAMYSIRYGKSTANSFHDLMADSMVFSDKLLEDNDYSNLFKNLSREDIEKFLVQWAQFCVPTFSLDSVWIVIDGSNMDSQCKDVDLCEQGYNKSKSNKDIIAFSYAVTSFGLPVYYEVYRGGLVDAKALKRIVDFLTENKITVEGVILDRGYCTETCLNYLRENNINFKVILKSNTEGFKTVVLEAGQSIRLNANHLIKGTNLFGIQTKTKLFKTSSYDSFVSLYFNIDKLGRNFNKFIDKYNNEYDRLLQCIEKGEDVTVSSDMANYFTIVEENGTKQVYRNLEQLQLAIDKEGFFAVASNVEDSAETTYNIIRSKIYVEKAFMILKSELGYGSMHVQNIDRIYGKFFVAFVACIIRYFLFSNAKECNVDTNTLIRKLNLLEIIRDQVFTYPHQEGKDIIKIITMLGGSSDVFDDIKDKANEIYYGKEVSFRYRKTRIKSHKGTIELDENLNRIPSKPGVHVGDKRPDTNKDGSPRKKPGRKPKNGTSLSETDSMTQEMSPDSDGNDQGVRPTKKPGVPKGTKRGKFNKWVA